VVWHAAGPTELSIRDWSGAAFDLLSSTSVDYGKGFMAARRITQTALAVAIAALVACTTVRRSGNAASLASGDWRAVEINGQMAIPPDVARRPWLRFAVDSGRVTGFGGCNRLAGPITLSGSLLEFGALAMKETRDAATSAPSWTCPPAGVFKNRLSEASACQ
jgi:hypothetical protein